MQRSKTRKPPASSEGTKIDESRRSSENVIEGAENDYASRDKNLLLSLDKLLNAAQDLMKQESTLDRAAFEHLRQLRVKVRFAISSTEEQPGALPKQAPLLWDRREDRELSPLRFLETTYKSWLDAGTISRSD